jgi:hypothetical protein
LDIPQPQLWRKVARVIGDSFEILEGCGIRPSGTIAKIIDMRMASLVGSARLEAQGDIRKWRYSEVRLPDRSSKVQNQIPVSLYAEREPVTEPHDGGEWAGFICH